MKCTKCGKTINGKLCLNCGATNDYEYSNNKVNNSTIKNNKINIQSLLIIFFCIAIIGGLAGGIVYLTRPKKIDLVIKYNASEMIEKDFKNNKISVNEYVLYSAYSVYDYKKLPKKYQTNTFQFVPDISYMYTKYQDELTSSTKEYLEEKIYLKNVKLGPKTEDVSYIPFVDKVEADGLEKEWKNIVQLDKAYASNNTLIWYTTEGNNSIDESVVKKISDEIDEVIQNIENAYGIKYQYKNQFQYNEENKAKREELLKKLNIPVDYINKLNIYLYNFGEGVETGGTYVATGCRDDNKNITRCNTQKVENNSIMLPYIVLNTSVIKKEENTKVFYTHELYHHFQYALSSKGEFDLIYPNSNSNNEQNFTMETSANHAAALLNPDPQNVLTGNYLRRHILLAEQNIEESINKIDGYDSFRFLEDYSNTIENGRTIIRDSILYEDRIQYLLEQSKGKFGNVMANYGFNTFTNNYSIKSFRSYIGDNLEGVILPLSNNCINKECKTINPASINYYKIDLKDMKNKYLKIKSKNIEDLKVQFVSTLNSDSVSSTDKETNKSYYIFNNIDYDKKSDVYTLTKDSIIETDLSNYKDDESIFVIISNGSISKSGNYEIITNDKKEGTNEDQLSSAKEGNVKVKETPKSVTTKIYLNDENLNVESFNYNWRTYVNLEDFCEKLGCIVDSKDGKKVITRDVTSNDSDTTGKYVIELDLKSSNYNSKLVLNNNTKDYFNLVQENITDKPCPTGKDNYGEEAKKNCTDTETYVPIRFIMQGLGYIVDWKPEENENKVLFYDNVLKDFEENNYKFVFSTKKVNLDEKVEDPIPLNKTNISLKKDTMYYVYLVDKDDKITFKSSLGFVNPINSSDTNIGKYFKKINDDKNNIGIISTGDIGNTENIIVVGNYKIPKKEENQYRTENVSYPIYYEVNLNISE